MLIIEEAGIRSARHFWQRRWEVGVRGRKRVGCGGEEDGSVVEVVEELGVELWRRRKGMLGRR